MLHENFFYFQNDDLDSSGLDYVQNCWPIMAKNSIQWTWTNFAKTRRRGDRCLLHKSSKMAPSGNDYLRGVRKDLFCTISTYALFVFHKWETFVYIRIVFTNFLHLYVFMNQSALRTIVILLPREMYVNYILRFNLSKALSLVQSTMYWLCDLLSQFFAYLNGMWNHS